jgi:hypothetical protein
MKTFGDEANKFEHTVSLRFHNTIPEVVLALTLPPFASIDT